MRISLALTAAALAACGGESTIAEPWISQVGSDAADTTFGIAVGGDGDVVVAGATAGSLGGDHAGNRDVYLTEYSTDGVVGWTRQLGGAGNDSPLGLSISPDGSVYVGGFTDGDFAGSNAGSADVWIAKFDPDGAEQWRRQIGGDGWDRGFDVTAFEGGAYITGYTASVLDDATNKEGFDGFAARFTSEGDLEWVRHVGTDAADWGQGSSLAPDGGLYFTGYTEGTLGADHAGDKDAFVVRLSSEGDVVWTKQFGTAAVDWPQGVGTTADGGVLLAGSTEGDLGGANAGGRDAFVASFDADGNHVFTTQFGTSGVDSVFEVREAGDAIVATGSTDGELGGSSGDRDGFLVWLDGSGEVLEFDQRGSDAVDDLTGLAISPDGDVFFSGSSFGDLAGPNAGDSDIVIGATFGEPNG